MTEMNRDAVPDAPTHDHVWGDWRGEGRVTCAVCDQERDAVPDAPRTEAGKALVAKAGSGKFVMAQRVRTIEVQACSPLSEAESRDTLAAQLAQSEKRVAMLSEALTNLVEDIEDEYPDWATVREAREALSSSVSGYVNVESPTLEVAIGNALDSGYVAEVTGGPWESGEIMLVARYIATTLRSQQ